MIDRKTVFAACCLVLLGLAAAAAGSGYGTAHRTNHLTFNRSVALPGVTLAAGTYIFERADPSLTLNVVRVTSRDRSRVYFTGLTQVVSRPRELGNALVTFGEAVGGSAPRITAWYPINTPTGHRFLYE